MRVQLALVLSMVLGVSLLAVPHPAIHDSVAPMSVMVEDTEATKVDPEHVHLRHAYICTTVSINEQKHQWLTAYHCVVGEDRKPTRQPLFIANLPATLVSYNPGADLAILVGDASAPAVTIRRTPLYWGEAVYVSGTPQGLHDFLDASGTVANPELADPIFPKTYAFFNLAICRGHSGAPVVDSHGELVSIVQFGLSRDSCAVYAGGATFTQMMEFLFK